MDCIVRPSDASQRGASKTSEPGSARVSLGGVGRNVAEAVARLGGSVSLLSAVGEDEPGKQLLTACRLRGVGVEALAELQGHRTATYTALLDGAGELVGAVADMDIFDEVAPEAIDGAAGALQAAGLVVCDANLPAATLERALCVGASGVPAWFEPVSVAKAPRGCCSKPWHLTSPNWEELMAMLGRPETEQPALEAGGGLPKDVAGALAEAVAKGLAERVLLTMGSLGVVLACEPESGVLEAPPSGELDVAALLSAAGLPAIGAPPFCVTVERPSGPELGGGRLQLLWFRPRPLDRVRDVTGAGDCLLAGMARAFSGGWPLERAVLAGMFCAHLTLFADGAVPQWLSGALWQALEEALLRPSKSRL